MEKYRKAIELAVRVFELSHEWTDTIERKQYAQNALIHSIDGIINVAMYDGDLSMDDFNDLMEEGRRIKNEADQ